jgi:serine/threonine-protein kinase
MAPEQLEGAPATVQSDLYALGLVMYELFTGKRAHAARTLPERMRDASTQITIPSTHIRDLDPAVERVILRCLADEPSQRPRSARAVIEALPGGDPLAAAMAAGETPSPRTVAAAGAEGSLSPRAAWLLLGTAALLFTLLLVARHTLLMPGYSAFAQPPEVLAARAEELLQQFGLPAGPSAIRTLYRHEAHLAWLDNGGKWASVRKGPAPVGYRVEYGVTASQSAEMDVMANTPGYTSIEVDPRGRLLLLLAAPPSSPNPRPIQWSTLVTAAGLDPSLLHSIEPQHTPLTAFDARAAWSGTYPGDTIPVRVEAAAWRGTPVYFRVLGPWDLSKEAVAIPFANRGIAIFFMIVVSVALVAGVLLAWRNLRLRRGDRQGAVRVAAATFVTLTPAVLLSSHYSGDPNDVRMVLDVIASALLYSAVMFLLYIGLEPYVRRRWPALLIASSRLLTGRFHDPMVGRDVLIGLAAGLLHAGIATATTAYQSAVRGFPSDPGFGEVIRINGARFAVGSLLRNVSIGLLLGFLYIVVLVLLAMLLRKRALAIGAFSLLLFVGYAVAVGGRLSLLPMVLPVVAVIAFITARYGLLANAVAQATFGALFFVPVAGDVAWARPLTMVFFGAVAIAAVWAFRTALGGRPAFATDALD